MPLTCGRVAVRESYRTAYIAERNPFFQHRHHIEVEVVGEHGCKLIEHACKGLFSRYREVVRRSAYHRRVVKHVVGEIESRDVIADCGFGDREIEVDQTDIEISQVQPDGNVCVGGACDVKSTFERKRCASFAECDADCNIVVHFPFVTYVSAVAVEGDYDRPVDIFADVAVDGQRVVNDFVVGRIPVCLRRGIIGAQRIFVASGQSKRCGRKAYYDKYCANRIFNC